MGKVLTESTTLKCAANPPNPQTPHNGTVDNTSTARLRIDGKAVLTMANVKGRSINGCGDTQANLSQVPCSLVKTVTGTATKLKVDSQPVLLDSIGGETVGSPAGTIVATGEISGRLQAV